MIQAHMDIQTIGGGIYCLSKREGLSHVYIAGRDMQLFFCFFCSFFVYDSNWHIELAALNQHTCAHKDCNQSTHLNSV